MLIRSPVHWSYYLSTAPHVRILGLTYVNAMIQYDNPFSKTLLPSLFTPGKISTSGLLVIPLFKKYLMAALEFTMYIFNLLQSISK